MAALVLAGCPAAPDPATTPAARDSPTQAPADDTAFRRQAHQAALARFLAAGRTALTLADPLTAHALGLGPLAPPPLSRSARAPLREAVDAALREADGIDRQALTPADGMLRDAVATALHAVRRELDQRPALRRDPTVLALQAASLLDAIETRLASAAPCEDCSTALRALGDELGRAAGQLSATSRASLRAAQQDVQALDQRLAALNSPAGGLLPGVARARQGLAVVTERLAATAAQIDTAPPSDWQAAVSGAVTPQTVQRLPDRLGATEFARRLADGESLRLSANDLAAELTLLLGRLDRMQGRLPTDTNTDALPVSPGRCAAAWAPLAAWATRNEALAAASFDCTTQAPQLGASPQTDAALTLALFEHGILAPTRAARRAAVAPALALSSGTMAAAGQRWALLVSGLIGAQAHAAAALAIGQARAELCVALAATLEHAELGTPDSRTQRLQRDCPESDPVTLIDAALARPGPALAPAGMILINEGPAKALALSRFWWAPLGLVASLADPSRVSPPDPPTLPPPTIETLSPRGATGG